ncbi:polysaccharide lyase 8 family protein [Streptomyces sp. NA04227]|uniref:polysaccharide lyase 8 family protein n=1 Tax=Streptomyces sp. NA04227 TaxID=2742136 RepID=UPI0015917357|nr:polysaccharide lyase 8 family protein [Streptomyces sp. NA04227]QKW08672.1 polysaccharide lyase 8 family protein [Streptomyces sp. NA04227]
MPSAPSPAGSSPADRTEPTGPIVGLATTGSPAPLATSFLSRRGLLRLATATALTAPAALHLAGPAAPAHAAEQDAFDALRLKWRALQLGSGFDPATEPYRSKLAALGKAAKELRDSLAPATGSLWPDLVYADPEPDTDPESYRYSEALQRSYYQLRTMAEAYAQPGTGLTGDAALRTAILTGFDHLHDEAYHAGQTRWGNWYNWQIGCPQALLDIAVHLHEDLGAERIGQLTAAVDHFVPDSAVGSYTGTSTGANRVDLCRVLALRGVLGKSAPKIALARDALSPVFPYVTKGDGLYADGSFIQHTYVPYAGSYGSVMLGGLSLLFALLTDSEWAVTDDNRRIIFDSVDRAYAPFLFNGLAMDSVSGRAISRGTASGATGLTPQSDHVRGHLVIAAIALLARSAPATYNERWQSMIKGWSARARYAPLLTDPALGVAAAARLAEVESGPARPSQEPVEHRLFAGIDRAVHRRPGWAANVSMASRRITYYENGNGENLRGWHTGSGMLYWWPKNVANGQYSDAFWPTVDPYRLPGTTTSKKKLADGEGGAWGAARPDVRWTGGTSDGTYGISGQHLRGLSSTLTARKSWLFLDDAVLCLTAGVRGTDGTGVDTVVDNRNLGAAGTHRLTVDGKPAPDTLGWSATLKGARWAHLAGHGGYVFPGGADVRALREERTGAWRDINQGGSDAELTRRYLTLWFDHGTDPAGGACAYLVLPGASTVATAARAADSGWLKLLANTEERQGATVPSLGLTAVNFWSAGRLGDLSVTVPASVLVRVRDGRATVCVAEPPREGVEFELTWHRPVRRVLSKDRSIEVTGTGDALTLRVTPGTLGASHRCEVSLG